MDEQKILETLINLLEANRIKIRKELLGDSPGGLCRIGNEKILFLDKHLKPADQAKICALALVESADIDHIYLIPEVREFVERHKKQ